MEKLAEVLLEMAKQGGPAAQHLITMYYVYWMFAATSVSGTLLGAVYMICRTVLKCNLNQCSKCGVKF